MGAALHLEDEFDPATSERSFRLAMSDYAIAVVHEPLVRLIGASRARRAPDASSTSARTSAVLGPGAARLRRPDRAARASASRASPGRCGATGWCCMADRGNPRLVRRRADARGPRRRCRTRSPSFGPGVLTPVDRAFGELGIDRRVALQVAGFLPLPFVIEGTDMVAVVPEKLARIHTRRRRPGGAGRAAVRRGGARRGLLVRRATGSPTRRTAGSSTGSTRWPRETAGRPAPLSRLTPSGCGWSRRRVRPGSRRTARRGRGPARISCSRAQASSDMNRTCRRDRSLSPRYCPTVTGSRSAIAPAQPGLVGSSSAGSSHSTYDAR